MIASGLTNVRKRCLYPMICEPDMNSTMSQWMRLPWKEKDPQILLCRWTCGTRAGCQTFFLMLTQTLTSNDTKCFWAKRRNMADFNNNKNQYIDFFSKNKYNGDLPFYYMLYPYPTILQHNTICLFLIKIICGKSNTFEAVRYPQNRWNYNIGYKIIKEVKVASLISSLGVYFVLIWILGPLRFRPNMFLWRVLPVEVFLRRLCVFWKIFSERNVALLPDPYLKPSCRTVCIF